MDIWWQKIKRPLLVAGIIVVSIFVIVTIVGIVGGYFFNWGWTGIKTKTLWDWLNLLAVLAIPVLVGLGAAWFTARQNHELDIAVDNQQEAALQNYIDKMSELLLEKNLRDSAEEDEVRNIARIRTLTVLSKLDPTRKWIVLKFLFESELIKSELTDNNKPIVDLSYANLKEADLYDLTLFKSNLEHTNLSYAKLEKADLRGANLRGAKLIGTDLSGVNLSVFNDHKTEKPIYTDLSGACLDGADLRGANLSDAKYNTKPIQEYDTQGNLLTYEPTKWPEGFDPKVYGATCVDC
jgi:uncharacterized protein YjbI with pentapeptide repeats